MNQEQKPKVIFILGGPGSGKGTQCQRMVERYNFIHYSTGDLLRQFIKTDCKLAQEIRQLLKEGKLAPSQMLVEIIKTNIFKQGKNDNVYLIDGFPRSAGNYQAWKQVMGSQVIVKDLIYLDCTFETLQRRLLERGKTSGRSDDNIETIKKRFYTYSQQTTPFLKYYKENVGIIHHLNGQEDKDKVSEKIRNILMQEQLI